MKKRNFLAVLASFAVVASMCPMTVSAENYNTVKGSTTSFDKYLVMDKNANVPNVSFEYTVESGTAQTYNLSEQTIEIYSGPSPEKIAFSGDDISDTTTDDKKFEIAFANGDTTSETADASDCVKNLDDGEKYAKKTAALSFADVEFDEPGIYRYIISETQGTEQGISYDADNTRVLDVYIVDDEGTLAVAAYILHANDGTVTIDGTKYGSDGNVISKADESDDGLDSKSQGFTNEYTSHKLVISKTVTGNQGSKDKYFKFEVEIKNAVAGTVYNVDLSKADAKVVKNSATNADYIDKENPSSITVGDDGTAKATFYLQNGQYVTILGIADGTAYEIKETSEDYVPGVEITGDTTRNADSSEVSLSDGKVYDTELTADTQVAFTNNRHGTIPTGVILSVAAPVAIGIAVLGGIVFLFIRNKKRDAEEE